MSVKLFVETNLDTSVFLLVNPNTEIKQLRGKNLEKKLGLWNITSFFLATLLKSRF